MSSPLFLTEQDIVNLTSVPESITALEAAFLDQAAGKCGMVPRQRLLMHRQTLQLMAAHIPGYFGYKAYTTSPGTAYFQFFLFDERSTGLLAIMEADTLGQIRTGAASGVATRHLAQETANEAVIFGSGWQAESQLIGICAVRPLTRIWVVNRTPERREAFMRKMQPKVDAELVAGIKVDEAVGRSQIITTITGSREPVLRGEWLQPGQHINAAGSNMLIRRELDDPAIRRCTMVVVDSLQQAQLEAGELHSAVNAGACRWQDVVELKDVVSGSIRRSKPADITLFKSVGIALEDLALAKQVYERAVAQGAGGKLEW